MLRCIFKLQHQHTQANISNTDRGEGDTWGRLPAEMSAMTGPGPTDTGNTLPNSSSLSVSMATTVNTWSLWRSRKRLQRPPAPRRRHTCDTDLCVAGRQSLCSGQMRCTVQITKSKIPARPAASATPLCQRLLPLLCNCMKERWLVGDTSDFSNPTCVYTDSN